MASIGAGDEKSKAIRERGDLSLNKAVERIAQGLELLLITSILVGLPILKEVEGGLRFILMLSGRVTAPLAPTFMLPEYEVNHRELMTVTQGGRRIPRILKIIMGSREGFGRMERLHILMTGR